MRPHEPRILLLPCSRPYCFWRQRGLPRFDVRSDPNPDSIRTRTGFLPFVSGSPTGAPDPVGADLPPAAPTEFVVVRVGDGAAALVSDATPV